jgi:hypothetical protein
MEVLLEVDIEFIHLKIKPKVIRMIGSNFICIGINIVVEDLMGFIHDKAAPLQIARIDRLSIGVII